MTTPKGTIPRVPPSRAISSLGRVICLYRLRTGPPTMNDSRPSASEKLIPSQQAERRTDEISRFQRKDPHDDNRNTRAGYGNNQR